MAARPNVTRSRCAPSWREPGSRHSAWAPEGGVMLAIFQVPNKFHEKDGRVTDPTGKIWDEVWGHTGKG